MGEMDDIPLKNTQPCGAEVIRAYKSGVLEGFRKNTQDVDYLIDLSMDYAIGNEVKEFKVGPDRIGQIIVKGNSPQAVINNLATVKSNLQLKIR